MAPDFDRDSTAMQAPDTPPAGTDLDKAIISSYKEDMRRKKGALLPLEIEILQAAAEATTSGDGWIHGFALAKALRGGGDGRLTSHGTLYKALGRLTEAGLIDDHWEDPDTALAEGRPRRRLYQINGTGRAALARAENIAGAGDGSRATGPSTRIAPA